MVPNSILKEFNQRFDGSPTHYIRSPGRINLIGEHIDYCGGLVMPMAINQSIHGWYRFNQSSQINVYSEQFGQQVAINPLDVAQKPCGQWRDYPQGILRLGVHRQLAKGFDLYIRSDIDAGGLSSSASLLAMMSLINHQALTGEVLALGARGERLSLALLCQQAENQFVGVPSGIMDPVSVLIGGAIVLACQTLKFEQLKALPLDYCFVVMDTRVPRTLASSGYAQRVDEIQQIKSILGEKIPAGGLALCPEAEMVNCLDKLTDPSLNRRARHIFSEQRRVKQAADAINADDLEQFGQLMQDSHRSLQRDYEVSCPELDLICSLSKSSGLSLGARMTGAGFGGCAISLIRTRDARSHASLVKNRYMAETGLEPRLITCEPATGTQIIEL